MVTLQRSSELKGDFGFGGDFRLVVSNWLVYFYETVATFF